MNVTLQQRNRYAGKLSSEETTDCFLKRKGKEKHSFPSASKLLCCCF